MTIDRIGSVEPLQPGKKPGRVEGAQRKAETDSVAFSSEAVEKAELYRAVEIASAAPDARADRIAELKRKIDDPEYLTNAIVEATADRVMAAFGL